MACPHFPKQSRDVCPICFPDAVYEIGQSFYEDEPVAEVLRNGGAWNSPWDRNFRFGRTKAAMILHTIDVIQEFALSEFPAELIPEPRFFSSHPGLLIVAQTLPSFVYSTGIRIDEPYMHLSRLRDDSRSQDIGFGQRKAAALVILKDDLRSWLQKVRGRFV